MMGMVLAVLVGQYIELPYAYESQCDPMDPTDCV